MNISKSRYTAYCQCPKNLWLGVYHPEVAAEVDPAAQARFEKGTEVGELAKRLFPNTVDVTTHKADGSLDLAAMIEKTRHLMADGTPVIAEAAFSHDGCYCAVDLLRREGNGWAIYEVKSTGTKDDNGNQEKLDKYLPDIAYQTWVLRQCGVNVTGINLVCLNSDYVRHGALDIQQLFVINDMREAVQDELAKVPLCVPTALKLLSQEEEPDMDLSDNCNKPYRCAFLQHCMQQHGIPTEEPTVFDLYGMWFSKKVENYRAGRITLADMREQKLTPIQQMQIECTLANKEYINREGIRRFLDGLTYPLYFLDFETMQDAVPQYDGTHPYQQVPFQYSLHIKKSADASFEHREFLAPSKSLAGSYPDLAGHLMNIHANMKDLLVPFREGNYYVPAMNGSFSIKKVLPALFPSDPELDYHSLDDRCQNGGDAMTIFPRIKDMSPNEAAASREALLRYCELDTWAMVKVWEKLKMETIITKLKNNPIFSMSLGSKELFHSNFLEYLWNVNQEALINVINENVKKEFHLPYPLNHNQEYEFGREIENFDICIFHKEEGKKVYDLVIENKVKSIPYKEQLEEYVKKAKDSKCCRFILLTLSDDFPDKDNVKPWEIVGYNEIKESISKYYKSENDKHLHYIKDYCDFVEHLVQLKDIILPKNNEESTLFESKSIEDLKSVRLHDLYIKLRCSMFALNLKNELKKNGIPAVVIDKYSNRKIKEEGKRVVNLNIAINQGVGQIAAWICDGEGPGNEKSNTYEIVIQGNQYRHGINQLGIFKDDIVKGEEKYNQLNKCFKRLGEIDDKGALQFLNFYGATEVHPNRDILYYKGTKIEKSGPFCCYDNHYIYRYRKIDGMAIKTLMNKMISDIKEIYNNLPNLY